MTGLSVQRKRVFTLCLVGVCLAFVVIMLGAITRLNDTGLGCPGWPSSFGHLTVPSLAHALKTVNHLFSAKPVVTDKAWMGIANVLLGCPLVIALLRNLTVVSLLLVSIRALIMLNKEGGHVAA